MNFEAFKKASEAVFEWLKKEYAGLRASQASPSILDGVRVEAYGSPAPINQVATVSVEGPKSLRITPWDKSLGKAVDEAIRLANLGVSVALDSDGVRISFPDLTSERRVALVDTAKEKLEEARVRVRNERVKTLGELERLEKAGSISKDDRFRQEKELQKLVDEINRRLEEQFEKKEKEIKL